MVLDEFKGDIAFSRAGGMHNGSLSVLLHHRKRTFVGFSVVRVQVQSHSAHLSFLGL